MDMFIVKISKLLKVTAEFIHKLYMHYPIHWLGSTFGK